MDTNPLTMKDTLDRLEARAREYAKQQKESPFNPKDFRYTSKTLWGQFEQWAKEKPDLECVYAVGTCWWSLFTDQMMPYHKGPLPCDPRGSMLMQGNLRKMLDSAIEHKSHYGKHGLLAFSAAFHGNLIHVPTGRPTSFEGWDKYNAVLDAQGFIA